MYYQFIAEHNLLNYVSKPCKISNGKYWILVEKV